MGRITAAVLAVIALAGSNLTQSKTEAPTRKLSTYILFSGNCREAMTFYRDVLGGSLRLTTVGDSPMAAKFPEPTKGKIVNATLTGKDIDISASDWLRPDKPVVQGNNVCLYLKGGKPEEVSAVFEKLSSGADVTDPLRKEPFGVYGALTDRFGVRWMFQTDDKE